MEILSDDKGNVYELGDGSIGDYKFVCSKIMQDSKALSALGRIARDKINNTEGNLLLSFFSSENGTYDDLAKEFIIKDRGAVIDLIHCFFDNITLDERYDITEMCLKHIENKPTD